MYILNLFFTLSVRLTILLSHPPLPTDTYYALFSLRMVRTISPNSINLKFCKLFQQISCTSDGNIIRVVGTTTCMTKGC